jgi:urea transport system substrate-binding protein
MQNRRTFLKAAVLSASIAAIGGLSSSAWAADTIKVGVLHSLSGTMAISETALKETALMTIEEINAKGGVLGKKLEPVVVSRPPTGRSSPRRRASCCPRTRWP